MNPLFLKQKKAQSSFELIVIIGLLLLIVLSALGVVLYQSGNARKDEDNTLLKSVADVIRSEVSLAEGVHGEYYREFTLPTSLNGRDYQIIRTNNKELVVKIENSEHIVFFNNDILGDLNKGSNFIKKTGTSISFNG